MTLPIYWKNKLFTDDTKERLWINKLDKDIQWICGNKVKKTNIEAIKKLLQRHRQRNAELGYGGRQNENRKIYEEKRREILANVS